MLSRIFRDDVENIQANRKRQIDTLKIFNDNVTEIKEDAEYKVEFLIGDVSMCMYISLPPDFPSDKPSLRVHPPLQHPWLNTSNEVANAPGLLNFTVHSDLGRVVQVIVREFQLRGLGAVTQNSISMPISGESSLALSTNQQPLPMTSGGLPELVCLKLNELQQLDKDPQQLDDFVLSLQQLEHLSKVVDCKISEIQGLAEGNLSKQEQLSELREKVLNYAETAQQLKASFDDKNRQFEALSQQYQPENIKEALRAATMESDESAESIADDFLNGAMDIDQFLVSYIDKRKLSQSRKTKEEKLTNQLLDLKRAGY